MDLENNLLHKPISGEYLISSSITLSPPLKSIFKYIQFFIKQLNEWLSFPNDSIYFKHSIPNLVLPIPLPVKQVKNI